MTAFDPARDRDRISAAFEAIAVEAAQRILEVQATAFDVNAKSDASPVTAADLAAHEVIRARVARALPGIPIVSEEDETREEASLGGTFVLVDPLDGTKEFVSGSGDFTVNIALVVDGSPVVGVIVAPARRQLWSGVVGLGATTAEISAADSQIGARRSIAVRGGPLRVAVASRTHRDAKTDAFLASHALRDVTSVGSSLKFCLVAEGVADVYPRFGPTMEWDTAAGQAIVASAGGCVTTPEGAPLRYGKASEGLRNGAFVAWGSSLPIST